MAKPGKRYKSAAELLDNSKIAARLLELRQDAESKALITLEAHLDELAALRDEAKAKGQFSAAIRAEELRGRLCKLYEAPDEPEETRQPPSERPRTPEEEAHFRKILEPFARPARPLEAEPIALKALAIPGSTAPG